MMTSTDTRSFRGLVTLRSRFSKDALAKRSTLYQGFAQGYLREATRELGNDVSNPRFFLTSAAILPTNTGASAYEVFLTEFQPVSFIKSDQWRLFPYLNLVFLHAYEPEATTTQPLIASVSFYRGKVKAFETAPLEIKEGLDPKSKALPLRFNLSLDKLQPGEYNCQVTVLDTTNQKAAFWQAPVMLVP